MKLIPVLTYFLEIIFLMDLTRGKKCCVNQNYFYLLHFFFVNLFIIVLVYTMSFRLRQGLNWLGIFMYLLTE